MTAALPEAVRPAGEHMVAVDQVEYDDAVPTAYNYIRCYFAFERLRSKFLDDLYVVGSGLKSPRGHDRSCSALPSGGVT
jgi:hypothetical protein